MVENRLGTALRSLVRRYGADQVDRALREISRSESRVQDGNRRSGGVRSGVTKKRSSVSAQEYVAKMSDDPEKIPLMSELAKRFEQKTFLPTVGDIRNFCQAYGVDEPASKSRASAVPRIFRFVATMSCEEMQSILDGWLFSGPSRLGPVADAIRENGRAAAFRERRMKGAD